MTMAINQTCRSFHCGMFFLQHLETLSFRIPHSKMYTCSYPAQLYSLLSTHIRTFLHLGQCHAGCSPKAEGISIVCRVKNPRIPFFARSVSEVNSYQLSKPAPTHSVMPCSISAPQSRHCMIFPPLRQPFLHQDFFIFLILRKTIFKK